MVENPIQFEFAMHVMFIFINSLNVQMDSGIHFDTAMLISFQLPTRLFLWDSLPRNAMGKVNCKHISFLFSRKLHFMSFFTKMGNIFKGRM